VLLPQRRAMLARVETARENERNRTHIMSSRKLEKRKPLGKAQIAAINL